MPPIQVPDSPDAMRAFVQNMIVPQLQAMTDEAFVDIYIMVASVLGHEITRRDISAVVTTRLQAELDKAGPVVITDGE